MIGSCIRLNRNFKLNLKSFMTAAVAIERNIPVERVSCVTVLGKTSRFRLSDTFFRHHQLIGYGKNLVALVS